MILAAPALEIKLYVPLAIPGLRILLKMRKERKTFIKSYVKAGMLTHDREQARRYEQDSLIAGAIAANVLVDLHDASVRLIDDAGAITSGNAMRGTKSHPASGLVESCPTAKQPMRCGKASPLFST